MRDRTAQFDVVEVMRLMASRLGLWDNDLGAEIVEEWSAKLGITLDEARAVTVALEAGYV